MKLFFEVNGFSRIFRNFGEVFSKLSFKGKWGRSFLKLFIEVVGCQGVKQNSLKLFNPSFKGEKYRDLLWCSFRCLKKNKSCFCKGKPIKCCVRNFDLTFPNALCYFQDSFSVEGTLSCERRCKT